MRENKNIHFSGLIYLFNFIYFYAAGSYQLSTLYILVYLWDELGDWEGHIQTYFNIDSKQRIFSCCVHCNFSKAFFLSIKILELLSLSIYSENYRYINSCSLDTMNASGSQAFRLGPFFSPPLSPYPVLWLHPLSEILISKQVRFLFPELSKHFLDTFYDSYGQPCSQYFLAPDFPLPDTKLDSPEWQ